VTAGDGEAAMLHVRITEMPGRRDAAWAHVAIDPSNPSALVDACLSNLYEVLGRPTPENTAGTIMSGMDSEHLASWGRAIADASTDTTAVAERAGELLAMHPAGAGRYTAARLYARAGRHNQAAETVEDLGGGAAVMAARYYRYADQLEKARRTLAKTAGKAEALTWESDMELFLIDAWEGRIDGDGPAPGAGGASGEVLLYRALATVHDTDVLVDYRPAATAYAEAIGTDAFGAIMEIGERCRRGGSLHAAQRAFGKAVAMAPEDGRGWKAYARSFIDLGDSSGAIRIYLNAVELEPLSREAFLLTAGRMLEGEGELEEAAAAIDSYIAAGGAHPDVVAWRTRLAAAEGDCAGVLERAASMDKRWRQRPEIVSVLRQCGDEAPVDVPVSLAMDARPRLRKSIRWAVGVTGGALAAGGMVAGLRANSRLEPLHDSYMASRDKGEVQSLRTELQETLTARTIAYTLAAAGAAILTLDITIPAVRR
jgi:tetratricopeptide (TPR) repeat protein